MSFTSLMNENVKKKKEKKACYTNQPFDLFQILIKVTVIGLSLHKK